MITIDDLLNNVGKYNMKDTDMIKKAYDYAYLNHFNQTRESGEAYITHPLNVAYILSLLHADSDTICAALLHDILEDCNVTKLELECIFNHDIASLVDGVTKISKLNFSTKQDCNYANTRKIITSIKEDVRIVIIKLADRLHNMRTLEYKSVFKQKENALETLEIFVPLSYYIGAYQIKNELEDLSLKYLKPDSYKEIEEKRNIIISDSNISLSLMKLNIEDILNRNKIENEIMFRIKNIYGIYKRLEEGQKLEDIHDLLALKVIVNELKDCYYSLGLVHSLYHPLNNKFKDFICNPKTNMYKSLHTTVFGNDDSLVQIQIRTFEMDKIDSLGITAYFDINKGDTRSIMQNNLKDKCQFLDSLKDIDSMFNDNMEFVSQVKNELFADKIYVFTYKGDVIELPKGATLIDLAYKIHTDIGNNMLYGIVNDEIKNATYVLNNEDRVKIVTDVTSYPKLEWLDYVKTATAKKKIKEYGKKINI